MRKELAVFTCSRSVHTTLRLPSAMRDGLQMPMMLWMPYRRTNEGPRPVGKGRERDGNLHDFACAEMCSQVGISCACARTLGNVF